MKRSMILRRWKEPGVFQASGAGNSSAGKSPDWLACDSLALVLKRFLAAVAIGLALSLPVASAQEIPADSTPAASSSTARQAAEALANLPDTKPDESGTDPRIAVSDRDLDLFQMLKDGGWPMIPILFLLIIAITFSIERLLGLRRAKVIPRALTREFGRPVPSTSGFDPRKAYRVCQENPSAAATVIRTMLLKIGRPHSEVEHAVEEASNREANRLYGNVRWLHMTATISPLLGLFGTVWGMINAFYAMAQLGQNASKATVLADGIVLALVTTLAGLFVAIPAAIAAHYFEGVIRSRFREMDEMLFALLPQIERFEGKLRANHEELQFGELVLTESAAPVAQHAVEAKQPVPPPVAGISK
ncbi:MAG: MotA/TolQ/ExbB proton channel family protein [Planctomycetales bacterium]